jgi:hypothetical protein
VISESRFSQRLRKEMRRQIPQAVIFKIHDPITGGIPDFSVTLDRRTLWLEIKLATNKPSFSPLQLETMRRLGRAAYVIWDPKKKLGDCFWVESLRHPACCMKFAHLVELLIERFVKAE